MTREEAIKIVQSATVWTDEERDALAMLIPELAESEDERIRKGMIDEIKAILRGEDLGFPPQDVLESRLAYLEKQKEQKPISQEDFDAAKHEALWGEQKPAEWSEEDEAAFGDLMWCIEQARKSAKDENDMGNIWFAENWLNRRLKSLRPQPHWKPSEEQMEALFNTLHPDDPYYHDLKSLYEQLKKL